MKRHPDLIPLAREHHAALAFARWAADYEGSPVSPLAPQATQRMAEFQPFFLAHADAEERELAAWAECAGASSAWDQLLQEHRAIRRQLLASSTVADLRLLGTLLQAHTRWEDRHFFCLLERHADASAAPSINRNPTTDHEHLSLAP